MFTKKNTPIPNLVVIKPQIHSDKRGIFFESWNKNEFINIGLNADFVQDNHSKSQKGVLRGIHFQTKHSQAKLVRVIKGCVFDVAIDLRKESFTFGKHFGIILSESNKKMFYIPEHFGHAYLALTNEVEFLYKTTDFYYPEHESGIVWNDPELDIKWPFKEYNLQYPFLSAKDRALPLFKDIIGSL